ncbi:MAG: exonuclease subunit SbcC [Oscillatoriaceae bacterium SKW80]|nr:exonuclease subunit SbcC [Oscillatoriaceae bacterium SKYG93]MCX8121407.1 exonuclease subunit SbcC [Oscillatoriaceae bacterium SKW80]MDW8451916.1 exonuclease subunit SbcC [Oscillatoriaceae cyanobacterium SKYGB_i_bin93]HIK29459.1 exonuclease subunit SbcC [Oscillatoriaceae cyanobacterium M7585_C2015_266]
MIPHKLSLKNFLSYREATLEFRGLHTACICGPNGAGKSSLLEALAWAIWGESRAATEDDIIHIGEKEARVDFTFEINGQIYRTIRSRQRGQTSSLEFQIYTGERFRSITERGVRATQEKIIQYLKLDYETFINSAYLRQGRADEFMLKRPSERKEILAELLKLNIYEELSEKAKDKSRQYKGQVELLEQSIESIQAQLRTQENLTAEIEATKAVIAKLQAEQESDRSSLQKLQERQQLRQSWQQQISWHSKQEEQLTKECERLQQEILTNQQRQQELEALMQQEREISADYAQFQQLSAQEEIEASKFQAYQDCQQRRNQLQEEFRQKKFTLESKLSSEKAQLEALQQQEEEIQQCLSQASEVEAGLLQLQQARARLEYLEQLQAKVVPIANRRAQLQTEIEKERARLSARLEELDKHIYQMQEEQQNYPQLQQAVTEISSQLEKMENKRVYQERVRQKGLERRSFMERLQAQQREYESRLAQMQQKIEMLQVPNAICPLCARPLDEHHWQLVKQKHTIEQQEILEQLWIIREQLATCEREIQVLREEYAQLNKDLADYNPLLQRQGSLQAQLDALASNQKRLQHIIKEKEQIEQNLAFGTYASDSHAELLHLEQLLTQSNYDEKDHALARGLVEQWRWAEIKHAQIKDAKRRLSAIEARKPLLVRQIAEIEQELKQEVSDFSRKIAAIDQQLAEIGYERTRHDQIRSALRQAESWLARYQELLSAREQYPQLQERSRKLGERLMECSQERSRICAQMESLKQQLLLNPDATEEIKTLERQILSRRAQLDQELARLGSLQQQQQHQQALQVQLQQTREARSLALKQQRVYQELANAFGKNGIQALTIENVLPQLEAETNQILARLSCNQLHVQFVTQRTGKSKRASSKLIDTLDIFIADSKGTRPYETYSGGEGFRINFALRLALARLLANRSGTALQMLIVDEGFGTQDADGCERLIAAINAIASDFACILIVTHMPQFKEAFQARIEVFKTAKGSQLRLSV